MNDDVKKSTYCDHAYNFGLKVSAVVNDVIIGMTHPGLEETN